MSDFAEWRPCSVCGLPVALPKRVHDECREKRTLEFTVEIPLPNDVTPDDGPYDIMRKVDLRELDEDD